MYRLAHPIEQHFHLPVYIENDVNTLTIAEQWFGAAHGIDHFLVVTVGRGIGLGIVTNGRFYRGAGAPANSGTSPWTKTVLFAIAASAVAWKQLLRTLPWCGW